MGIASDLFNETPQQGAVDAPALETPKLDTVQSLYGTPDAQKEDSLQFVMDETIDEKPERTARALELQKRTGIPKKFIDENFDELDKAAKQAEFNSRDYLKTSPKVADWLLRNPDYAPLLREDIATMGALESLVSGVTTFFGGKGDSWSDTLRKRTESAGQALNVQFAGAQQSIAMARQAPEEFAAHFAQQINRAAAKGIAYLVAPDWALTPEQIKYKQEFIDRYTPTPSYSKEALDKVSKDPLFVEGMDRAAYHLERIKELAPNVPEWSGKDIIGSAYESLLTSVLPMIATAYAGGGVVGGTVTFSGQVYTQSLAEGLKDGMPLAQAQEWASWKILSEGIPESIPLSVALKPAKGFWSKVLGVTLTEGAEEGLTEMADIAYETQKLDKEISFKEAVNRTFKAISVGFAAGGGMGTVAAGVDATKARQDAKLQEDFFKSLGDNATAAKLRERLPDAYQQIVKDITKDGPVENVYAPVEFFQSHFQEQNIDPRKLATELGIDRQYDEAINTGGKISIPLDVYAKNLAPTEHNAVFAKELSFAPDQMSSRETEEFLKEAEKEKEPETDLFRESLTQAMTPIREQLKAIYPADVADKNAAVIEARLRSRATRLGIDPQELMKQRPMDIVKGEVSDTPETTYFQIDKKEAREISELLVSALREKGADVRVDHWPTGSSYIDVTLGKRFLRVPVRISDHPPSPRAVNLKDYTEGPKSKEEIESFANRLLSALGGKEQDGGNELMQAEPGKPFYSAVLAATEALPQAKGTPEQMLAQIKKTPGVKAEEIEWLGLEEWIKQQGKSVTKEQIAEFVRANQVEVREVEKGGEKEGLKIQPNEEETSYAGHEIVDVVQVSNGVTRFSGTPSEARNYMEEEAIAGKYGATKFSSYQLPGGENYRELLLTLPDKAGDEINALAKERDALLGQRGDIPTSDLIKAKDLQNRIDSLSKERSEFKSGHFDEPNILAHIRFNERTDADGKRVLFIEEVQSDWHQQGRKKGYGKSTVPAGWANTADATSGDKVPDAPFKTTWPLLAMKRMIRYAAENGFDRIAWTTGEQQADRYDLSKQVEAITWQKQGDRYQIFVYPKSGNQIEKNLAPAEIPDFIGKEASDKITGSGKDTGELRGLDLKVGGEGMKAFYDQMLPSMVNKYVKKWGGKVGSTKIRIADEGDARISIFGDGTYGVDYRGDQKEFDTEEEAQRFVDGINSTPVTSIDITPAMRESVMQGQPLFQEGQDIKRGSISVSPTGDVIRLFQSKNLSTLLHELSHRWLFEMQDDANLPNAPQQIKDDLAVTLKYLGVESVEELDITKIPKGTAAYAKAVAANEKFAQTGEAYLMEGKSPSTALRRVFAQIRAWLVAVYKALKQGRLDVELTPEMRGVFDRLLATDEEIAQAKAEANAVPIFTTAVDAGMSDTEFAAYRKTIEDANREEREELDAKVMNEYKKTLTDIWKEEKAKVQAEVEAELDKDPIYAAMAKMKENGVKIARSEAGSLPRAFTAKDGIPADMAAEMLGFTSGEALVKALASVEPRGSRVSRETSIRMDQRFGNLLTDGTLVEEARKAVMGDGRAKIIEAEIKALNKKAREVKPFIKAKDKAKAEHERAGRDLYKSLVPKLADVRDHAASVIAAKPIRELRPMQYYNAARQASSEAINDVRKGDYLMAGYNKGRELLNLELYREANNAIDAVEKNRKYLQKFDKESSRKKLRGEFLVQIDDILERFDLRRRSTKAIDAEKQSLVDFIEKEAERLSAVVPDIAPVILNERYRKNYKEMTVEEMTGVVAAVKQLESLARREHEQYMAIRQMNFEQERSAIIDRLREFNPKHFDDEGNVIPIKPDFVPDASKAVKKLGDKFSGEFLNTETILNILEGGSFGQVEQSIFGRMSERSNWKMTRLEGLYKKLKPLFDQYSLVEKHQFGRKDIGIGMTRENAVVVALLNGNKEGRERLNNYGFDEAKIQRIIGHLDQRDFNLVNGIWDIFDQDLWPELKALNERTRGQAPPKVEAVPFQTRFGEQKGGYFTLKYDTELDERAHSFDETKAVKDLLGGSMGMSAKTNQGTSTKRLEGVKLRPRLDLNVFSEAVNETVHDLAYREAVADSMKLLNDPDIRDSIKAIAGTPAYRALVTRVRETAAPPRNPYGFIEKALTIARKNTIVTMLSGVRTALLNITGAVSVYARSFEKASPVSAGLLNRELGKFYSWRMSEMYEFATTHSEYMRHRFNNFDRDLQDMANKLTVKGKILPDTSQFLWLMGMTDRGVTVPVWNASFAEGMRRYKNDTKQAVEYADHIVRQTQGSGRDVDLAKIMSGHGGWGQLKKVFTMFQSFFNGQLGQLVRAGAISAREAQDNRAEAIAKYTARFILIVSIPAAISTIGGRDDDDMDENWFKKFAYIHAMYIAAMFPLVRDLASYTWSKFDKSVANYGLKLSPVQSAGEGVAKGLVAVKDIAKGEGTKKDVKDLIMGTSYAVGLPGKLISDVVLGTNAYLEGDKGPEAIIFGPGTIRE